MKDLDEEGRKTLARVGIRLGTEALYVPELLKPRAVRLRAQLWSAASGRHPEEGPPPEGRVQVARADTTPAAYDAAVIPLFESLDWLEERLSSQRYLMGDRITEADWRLFTTLIRFDPVYHLHFKCNRRRIVDYPALWAYTRGLYQWPGVAETVNFDHIVRHYHYSHDSINPHRIIPINPVLDYRAPNARDTLGAA